MSKRSNSQSPHPGDPDIDRSLPASFGQERLWFLSQLDPGSAQYHTGRAIRLDGSLNLAALEGTLSELVRRHESLRTTFATVDDALVQVIRTALPVSVAFSDLSHAKSGSRDTEVRQHVHDALRAPFDLRRGPLMRAAVLRLGPEEHILVLTVHHIIVDGWSMDIVMRELRIIYEALNAGQTSPLPPLAIQYPDYSVWQRHQLMSSLLESQVSYWRRQLADAPTLLQLPTDYPRSADQTTAGAVFRFTVPYEAADVLRGIANTSNATSFMVFLAAFQVVLGRHARQNDILVGVPIAGRTHEEIEPVVGLFANTLVLRTSITDALTFRELLQQVRETTIAAHENQDVPFERLVEELKPRRSLSHSPLFQVMFTFGQRGTREHIDSSLRMTPYGIESSTSKFDLTLAVQDSGSALTCSIEYRTDLFTTGTIERLAGHYTALLAVIGKFPDAPLSSLSLLQAREKSELLDAGTGITVPPLDGLLHYCFDQQATRTPDAVALTVGPNQLTYASLQQRADELGYFLRGLSVGPDVCVGVCLERTLDLVPALLAVLKAGGAYVPLDPSYPAERIAYMLRDSGARVVLTQASLTDRIPESFAGSVIRVDVPTDLAPSDVSGSGSLTAICPVPESLAYVIYTSGSTGLPKGVMITHQNAVNFLTWAADTFGSELAHTAATTSICFDLSVFEIFAPLVTGGSVVLFEDASELAYNSVAAQPTLLNGVPSVVAALVASRALPSSVHIVNVAGEPLARSLVDQLYAVNTVESVRNLYGPTEVTTYATACVVERADRQTPCIGQPIANTTAYVLDRSYMMMPAGLPGELYLGGWGVARGYLDKPALTAERFVPDPFSSRPGARLYRTGDSVIWRGDRQLRFVGRTDRQVKLRGFRIELAEIEAALRSEPAVDDCVAIIGGDSTSDQAIIAYVVPVSDYSPHRATRSAECQPIGGDLIQALRAALLVRLPEYMVPEQIVLLDSLPRTLNGKLDTSSLPVPISPISADAYVAPRTALESTVAQIWAEVLKLDRVGIYDNFFALGGNSLRVMQVAARIRAAVRCTLPLRALFDAQTVASLATLIQHGIDSATDTTPIKAPQVRHAVGESLPMSYAQQRLWLADELSASRSVYNLALAYSLGGKLDTAALQGAMTNLVDRHAVLRTTFSALGGIPLQTINDTEHCAVRMIDLTHRRSDRRTSLARRLGLWETRRPFDLGKGPPFRSMLIRTDDEEYILILTMHHIVADGWSLNLIARELSEAYTALTYGQVIALPTPSVQYADYALWERELLTEDALNAHLSYWRDSLKVQSTRLRLPVNIRRLNSSGERHAQSYGVIVPAGVHRDLEQLGQQEGATTFMMLLASFKVLLARYSGQWDIVVGCPMANRSGVEAEAIVGFFVNMVPVHTMLAADLTFRQILARTRSAALGAYEHQSLPFDKLVEALQLGRTSGETPLFDVVFAFQDETLAATLDLPGITTTQVSLGEPTLKFPLTLNIRADQQGLRATFTCEAGPSSQQALEQIGNDYSRLLEEVVAAPDTALFNLRHFCAADATLSQISSKALHAPAARTCLHERIGFIARTTPNRIAIACGSSALTYKSLDERANQLAHYLRRQGIGPELRVGVYLDRSLDFATALLAVLKAGGAYVPLDPSLPINRLQHILADAGLSLVITSSRIDRGPLNEAIHNGHVLPSIVDLDMDGGRIGLEDCCNAPRQLATDENLAYIIYTSGSTGTPKGSMIPHRSIMGYMDSYLDRPDELNGPQPPEVWLQHSSIMWDALTLELWTPLIRGGCCVLHQSHQDGGITLDGLYDAVVSNHVTTMWMTSSLFNAIVDSACDLLSSLQVLLIGGEQVAVEHVRKARAAYPSLKIVNGYGPSECTVFASCYVIPASVDATATAIPIGRPVGDRECYVLDASMSPVPRGVGGELYIGGASVPRGYADRSGQTAGQFVPNPFIAQRGSRLYRTGDYVRWSEYGELEFIERIDDQVKVRGFRVELGEIEAALRGLPAIYDAAVLARPLYRGGRELVAYVVIRSGSELTPRDLRDELRRHLPEYSVPTKIHFLAALPRTATGKIERHSLLSIAEVETDTRFEPVLPRSRTESVIRDLWASLLGRSDIGVHESFFDLGGHSLLAAQLIARIRSVFGVHVPLRLLFDQPTIEEQAAFVDSLTSEAAGSREDTPPMHTLQPVDIGPVSFAQERLLFLERLLPQGATYHVPYALRIDGALDVSALREALDAIVRRHDVLRATFPEKDGTPEQVIVARMPSILDVDDLRPIDEGEREIQVRIRIDAESRSPFDFVRGPLIRALLLQVGETTSVLVVTMHHLVTDGVSMANFFQELDVLYKAFVSRVRSPLQPLSLQYLAYAAWQRGSLSGSRLDDHLRYWTNHLAGAPTLVELPTDRIRPAMQTNRGMSYSFAIPPTLSDDLVLLGNSRRATLFMTLLAGLNIVLAKYTHQRDVVVGTVVAGRNQEEWEPLIGLFANTIALRVSLTGDPTFVEILDRARNTTLDAYEYQDVPFERLVEEIKPERTLAHSPIVQVMLSMPSAPLRTFEIGDLTARRVRVDTMTAKFDLLIFVLQNQAGGLSATIEYRSDLFDLSTIERLAQHYNDVLAEAASNPDRRLSKFVLSRTGSGTRTKVMPMPRMRYDTAESLVVVFERQALVTPELVGVVDGQTRMTYRELNRRANQLGHYLRRRGIGPESRVAVCLERRSELIVVLLGILKAGGAYVPLDPVYSAQRNGEILEDSGAALLITRSSLLNKAIPFATTAAVCMDLEEPVINSMPDDCPEVNLSPDNLAYVIYTSGSTGRPKGVEVTHRNVVRLLTSTEELFRFDATDVWCLFHSYAFDFSVWEMWGALAYGGRLVIVPQEVARSPEEFRRFLLQEQITILNQTPAAFAELVRVDGTATMPLTALRVVVFGGDALRVDMLSPWLDRYGPNRPQLVNMYGITETTVHVTYRLLGADDIGEAGHSPIGGAIPDLEVRVLDDHLNEVPIGVHGELYVGGDGLARGYLGRPSLTAERFVPNPFSSIPGDRLYKTGDLVKHRDNNDMEFVGRVDRQCKIRGFRIEPAEIEGILRQHRDVSDAVVVLQSSSEGDAHLVAYVLPADGCAPDAAQLREYSRGRLPEYMVPRIIEMISHLPLSASGKLERERLPKPAANGRRVGGLATSEDSIEGEVAELFANLLNVGRVTADDDFFNLGGHSIVAVRLVTRIQEQFNRDLPLADLYRYRTVRELARVLKAPPSDNPSPIVRIQPQGDSPPLFCPHAVGASVYSYKALARRLAPNYPLYGLRAFGLGVNEEPLTTVEALAERYVDAIKTVQPEGPYRICGWSFGGMIAYEMARQFCDAGDQVALLALIDTRGYLGEAISHVGPLVAVVGDLLPTGFEEALRNTPADMQVQFALAEATKAQLPRLRLALLRVYEANRNAWLRYVARPYGGTAMFMRALGGEDNPVDYWRPLVLGGIHVSAFPGEHNTILEEPFVGPVAEYLSQQLATVLNK